MATLNEGDDMEPNQRVLDQLVQTDDDYIHNDNEKMAPNVNDILLPEPPPRLSEKVVTVEEDHQDDDDYTCKCDQINYGDSVFTCAVVAPLVVSVWRGTWGLIEHHRQLFPFAQTFFLGMLLHVCFAVLRSYLLSRSLANAHASPARWRWLCERAVSRAYTYVFLIANILHWRGGWGLFDAVVASVLPGEDDPHRPVLIAALLSLLYAGAASLRSSRNLLASPYFLVTDGKEATYLFATRFKASDLGNGPNNFDEIFYVKGFENEE